MTDTFTEEKRERFGARGETFHESREEFDTDEMHKRTEETVLSFCPSCGGPLDDPERARRCVACSDLACARCAVEAFREKTYCRDCLSTLVPKDLAMSLLLAAEGVVAVEAAPAEGATDAPPLDGDVIEAERVGGDPLREMNLVGPDGMLTSRGRELYHVGMALYGDEPDVAELREEVQLHKVTQRR